MRKRYLFLASALAMVTAVATATATADSAFAGTKTTSGTCAMERGYGVKATARFTSTGYPSTYPTGTLTYITLASKQKLRGTVKGEGRSTPGSWAAHQPMGKPDYSGSSWTYTGKKGSIYTYRVGNHQSLPLAGISSLTVNAVSADGKYDCRVPIQLYPY